ncbi:uncharacterized protein At3g17950-like isoform X2 [Tasmannia lanceolata]
MRVGLIRNRDFSGSISFSTLVTGSPSSSDSSSDLDTESTGSFFHEKSITLGNLIGASSILELSGRTVRGRKTEITEGKKSYKSKTWFSLCTKACGNSESPNNPPSLGHFLEVERRAANIYRRNQNSIGVELDDFIGSQSVSEPNSLFVDGNIAPPQVGADGSVVLVRDVQNSSPWFGSQVERRPNRDISHPNGYGVPVLFSCVCGQS